MESNLFPTSWVIVNLEEVRSHVILKKTNLTCATINLCFVIGIILDMHAELYKDSEAETGTGYLIVLTTSKGIFKLDMEDDYQRYKTWATTINHMLMLSTSLSKYHLQFYKH